jgi:oligopeptide/dipeptide ABC transporter ATP-binding protein
MRQRVMIAMALACGPAVLIADEPTTALDVTIQAQVLELMRELLRELGTALLFITHDLGVVAEIADNVAVMYAGRIVEQGRVVNVLERPLHPYTRGLMRARPSLVSARGERLPIIEGIVPALHALPKGCRFVDRCPKAEQSCHEKEPRLEKADEPDHLVACPPMLRDLRNTTGAQP